MRQPTTHTHTLNCALVVLQKLWLYARDVTRQLLPRGSSLPLRFPLSPFVFYPISQPSGSRIPSVASGGIHNCQSDRATCTPPRSLQQPCLRVFNDFGCIRRSQHAKLAPSLALLLPINQLIASYLQSGSVYSFDVK